MQKIIKTISGIVALFMLAAFPITSFASGVPAINTLTASATTATTATLSGFFNANGAPTSTYFKYGTSASNLNSNSAIVNRGTGSGQFSQTITGLTPNTTYYFKAAGSNFYGQTLGLTTVSFTTTAAQTATLSLSTLPQTNVTSSVATLNGHYSATMTSPVVWFRYGTAANSLNRVTTGQSVVVGSNNFSANISGLQASTTYYFQAIGSQAGTQVVSSTPTLVFTTPAAPVASIVVTTVGQSNVTTTSATLNAHVIIANTTVTTRYFKYGTSASNLNSTLTVSGTQTISGAFTGTLTGLTPNTTYYFKAYAGNGNISPVAGNTTLQFTTLNIVTPVTYECNDGQDNDGNGYSDFPSDPGCSSATDNNEYTAQPTSYQCNDGFDNDADGLADFPSDPGCTSPTDNTEYNTAPTLYECNDGQDNDGNGYSDFPSDPGCSSATDNNEYTAQPSGHAPTATTVSANNVTANDVTLTGTINANNSYSYYWFEYGPNGSFSNSTSQMSFGIGSGNVTQALGSLQANTVYSYRLCASNAYGQNCGSTLSFTTLSAGCTYNCGGGSTGNAPIANTSSASNVTDTTASLFGFVNSNGASNAQVWFNYGMNGNLNLTSLSAQPTISGSQSVTAFLSNLQPNTVYSFQTCASNQYGQNCGNVLSFITNTNAYVPVQPPYYPPYNPTNPQYPQQPPIIIYTNNGGYDYSVGTSTLASLKINASKRDVARDDLITYSITLTNESSRSLKNVVMHVSAPMDLALSSASLGELSFATNTITLSFPTLAVGDAKTITVTARVASKTSSTSFVLHADASYLNTKTGERETVTAELMTGVGGNGLLAGVFGSGFGGGLIWFLIAVLVILLGVLAFSNNRRRETAVAAPMPPSRWPTN
ncbi:MAG: hypothetical protein KBC67_00860 [Candidatus Pacebacteria bacterium]|nr:hypothetical protein [Candidatus Paceibacterota bacterium]